MASKAAADLLLDLLEIFPDLEESLGDKASEFRDELLRLTGELDRDVDVPGFQKRVESFAVRLLSALSGVKARKLRAVMGDIAPKPVPKPSKKGSTGPDPLSGLEGLDRTDFILTGDMGTRGRGGGSGVGGGGAGVGDTAHTPPPAASKSRSSAAPSRGTPPSPTAAAGPPPGVVEVPVFFATERKLSGRNRPDDFFSGERGTEVHRGIARVTVPIEGRDVGDLPEPTWWKLEFKPDPSKHVIVTSIELKERESFGQTLSASLATADQQDLLLFVHGYNVTFTNAARRAAQISVDLKFPGRTLLYSWASVGRGDPRSYVVDEGTIQEISPRRLRAFLNQAMTEVGAKNVHIIAHSMGNRAVMNALEDLDTAKFPAGSATLGQVIFAAPDVAKDSFKDLAEAFKGRAKRCTLYASSRDVALKASKLVNKYPRAGDAGGELVLVDGVDTIDATTADTSLIGLRHSYFGSKRSILRDIFDVISGRAMDQRFELRAAPGTPPTHWVYRG